MTSQEKTADRPAEVRWLLWWRLTVGVGLLLALLFFVGLDQIGATVQAADAVWALAVVVGLAAWLLLGAAKVYLLLRCLTRLSPATFLPAYLTGWATSLFLPGQLGDVSQVAFLHRHGISVSNSGAAYVLDKSISLGWMLLVSVYGMGLYTPLRGTGLLVVVVLGGLAACVALLVLLRAPLRGGVARRFRQAMVQLLGQLVSFRGHLGTVLLNIALTIVKWLLLATIYLGTFYAFGQTLAFEAAATIPVMSSFVGYLPVTVGGAGTSEWTAVLLFEQVGVQAHVVLSSYLFLRVVLLAGALATVGFLRSGTEAGQR